MNRIPFRPLAVLLLIVTVGAGLLVAGSVATYQAKQVPPIQLGTSGGNVNDHTTSYCCSGTLGSLVNAGGKAAILSNSHVLSRSGYASIGDDISQPGMVDTGCSTSSSAVNIVADLASNTKPGTGNVDAAVATVRSGMVNQNGSILGVGVPSATPAAATLNRGVAKAGRTTGLTCASIGALNATINIQYESQCNGGTTWNVTYTNQVVINSRTFSAGGDSGSLIVTSDTAQPTALLYAGSSTTTIGNPISDVQKALNITFIGGGNHAVSCATGGKPRKGASPASLARARQAKENHADRLMLEPAVMGVGVGADDLDETEAVIVVYVEEGRQHAEIPNELDGVKVKVIRTDKIRAFGWNEPQPKSCSVAR